MAERKRSWSFLHTSVCVFSLGGVLLIGLLGYEALCYSTNMIEALSSENYKVYVRVTSRLAIASITSELNHPLGKTLNRVPMVLSTNAQGELIYASPLGGRGLRILTNALGRIEGCETIFEAYEINRIVVHDDYQYRGTQMRFNNGGKNFSCVVSKFPLGGGFSSRLDAFLAQAKLGAKQELLVRPYLLDCNYIVSSAAGLLVLGFLGIWWNLWLKRRGYS